MLSLQKNKKHPDISNAKLTRCSVQSKRQLINQTQALFGVKLVLDQCCSQINPASYNTNNKSGQFPPTYFFFETEVLNKLATRLQQLKQRWSVIMNGCGTGTGIQRGGE